MVARQWIALLHHKKNKGTVMSLYVEKSPYAQKNEFMSSSNWPEIGCVYMFCLHMELNETWFGFITSIQTILFCLIWQETRTNPPACHGTKASTIRTRSGREDHYNWFRTPNDVIVAWVVTHVTILLSYVTHTYIQNVRRYKYIYIYISVVYM